MWSFKDIKYVRSLDDLKDWWSDRYWTAGLRPGFDTRSSYRARSLRCWLGIHDAEWMNDAFGDYYDGYESGFGCNQCMQEVFPVRVALQCTLEESRILGPLVERYYDWKYRNADLT